MSLISLEKWKNTIVLVFVYFVCFFNSEAIIVTYFEYPVFWKMNHDNLIPVS